MRGEERQKGGEGGEGRGEEAFLVMWQRKLSVLNPPLTSPLPITLPYVDRFSNFFRYRTQL